MTDDQLFWIIAVLVLLGVIFPITRRGLWIAMMNIMLNALLLLLFLNAWWLAMALVGLRDIGDWVEQWRDHYREIRRAHFKEMEAP